jgi:hypothetical protein
MKRCLNLKIQRVQSNSATQEIETLLHSLIAMTDSEKVEFSVNFSYVENYCNISIYAITPIKLWKFLSEAMFENSQEFEWLRKRWIVVVQGESGWDDYLLLAHFDPSVKLDKT